MRDKMTDLQRIDHANTPTAGGTTRWRIAHRRPALVEQHGGRAARNRRKVNFVQPFEVRTIRTIPTKCAESPILHLWGKKTIKASFQYVSCKCFFLLVCLYNVIYKIRCDQKIQFNKKWTNKSIKAQQPANKELHIASDRKRIICKCSTKHMPSLGNVFEMNAPI